MERATRQRNAIHSALAEAARPLTPQEIHALALVHAPALGIATVYRTINAMLQTGDLVSVPLPGEAPRYELAGHEHHHHFHCTTCDRVFEVDGCPGDMQRLAPRGFEVKSHELTLYGRCRDCRRGHAA